jgi:serine phosphatase RsbU (regulator of sigma subunit)
MRGVSYSPAVRINMQPGDLLLFITDGFFECAREDGEGFGIPRLQAAVADAAQLRLGDFIPSLYEKAKAFVGDAPQADDMTAVVIRASA